MNLLEFQTPTANTQVPLWVGGQPDAADLQALREQGLQVVINLRPEAELQGFAEAALVAELGMVYEHLPVQTAEDFSRVTVAQFAELLERYALQPKLVHCASGNRVGALFALQAFYQQGIAAEAAIQQGEAYGMTKLSPFIASLMAAEA